MELPRSRRRATLRDAPQLSRNQRAGARAAQAGRGAQAVTGVVAEPVRQAGLTPTAIIR